MWAKILLAILTNVPIIAADVEKEIAAVKAAPNGAAKIAKAADGVAIVVGAVLKGVSEA